MKFSEAKEFLKVGMRVRLLKAVDHPTCNQRTGDVRTIIKNRTGSLHFPIIEGSVGGHDLENYNDELEILTEADGVTPWKDPRSELTPKFKVGDRVVALPEASKCYDITKEGWTGTGTKVFGGSIEVEGSSGHGCFVLDPKYFVKLPEEGVVPRPEEEAPRYYGKSLYQEMVNRTIDRMAYSYSSYDWTYEGDPVIKTKPRLFNRKENFMNQVFQAIKAKLSSTDKTLVKAGYLNSDGTRTTSYEQELKEMALKKLVDAEDTKEFRDELAAELKTEDKE